MTSTDPGMPGLGPVQSAAPYPLRLILNWGRRYSLWVFNFGLACCAIEFIAASTSRHDFIRLGVIPFAHGPRQADLMIVSGTVTDKMAPAVRRLYQQMPCTGRPSARSPRNVPYRASSHGTASRACSTG